MTRPAAPKLLPCGHFSQATNADGTPRCVMCAEREAVARMQAQATTPPRSGPGPTRAAGAATAPPAAATVALGTDSPQPGVYDLPDSIYHADPLRDYGLESLSSTSARLLLAPSTPANYRWAMDHPDDRRTPAMIFGKAVHAVTLQTGDLAVFDGASWTSKAGEQFLAEHPDHGDTVPVLARDVPAAKAMAAALLAHPVARLGLTGGQPEQAMFARDDRYGVWRRCKADYLAPATGGRLIVTDVKTTDSASPSEFASSAGKYGYHLQADNTAWLARRLGLARHATMIFAAVEKHPPYLVAVHEIDSTDLRRATALNELAAATFARCLETGTWPGYPERVHRISLPGWIARNEETTLDDALDEGEPE